MSEIVRTVTNAAGIKYFDKCGGWIGRQDGTENWRNNNPGGLPRGNPLRPGEVDDTGGNPMAVFETYADGQAAMNTYWQGIFDLYDPATTTIRQMLGSTFLSEAEISALCDGQGIDCTALISTIERVANPLEWLLFLDRMKLAKWQTGTQTGYNSGTGSGCGGLMLGGEGGVLPPRPRVNDPILPFNPITR